MMNTKTREFLAFVREKLIQYPSQIAVAGVFFWGLLIFLFSISLRHVWLAALFLLAAHALALPVLYAGFSRGAATGRRTPLALTAGGLLLLMTLLVDMLFAVSF